VPLPLSCARIQRLMRHRDFVPARACAQVVQADMAAQVAAYSESMSQLQTKATTMGGFFWQLMGAYCTE
jgi:hypothetical protein